MTLGTLILMIGAIALVLTMVIGLIYKAHNSWVMTYLQNFTGALFVFSGWVKAIDPLGTAYKMEQYFAEFQYTFEGTWMSFIAPLFPWMSSMSIGFSVFMIVFEIVLGIMLLIGTRKKLTAWLFFLLVAFFTVLTGFTYLTGYVPSGVNFFEFGKWGPYVETNMKVTDCGCFGDFIKLQPKTSFFKDIFLLIPAIYFLFRYKDMHQLFSRGVRAIIVTVSTIAVLLYCLSNYSWDLPHTDFRPFAVGVDVKETMAKEREAQENVKVLGYTLTNKNDGKVVELDYETFLKEFKNYPKEEWEYEQIKSEPAIPETKISDFELEDAEGNSMTEEVLNYEGYSLMIVCYKLYHKTNAVSATVKDTLWVTDTIPGDSVVLERRIDKIDTRSITKTDYIWDADYQEIFREKINPLAEAAEQDGLKVYAIVGGAGNEMIEDFRHANQTAFPFYQADDILLKTIVRSNPGVVLLKDGKVIMKWHHKKLPGFNELKAKYIK